MKTKKSNPLSLADVQAAARRIAGGVRQTPLLRADALSSIAGMEIWLKRDDLQRTGAFKERGARNALLSLSEAERACGVVAASAGNHALGLAFHAGQLGVRLTVVMPSHAAHVKVNRCLGLGAEVVLHGANFEQAEAKARELATATGATYVHPFDDASVIAGQGTLALETLAQGPAFDALVLPVGGGGLLAGAALAVKALSPSTRVIAVEPANAAGFLGACLRDGPWAVPVLPSLADGLAVSRVGELTWRTAVPLVDEFLTVTEDELADAIAVLSRAGGVLAEGAGAAAFAAVLAGKVRGAARVAVPITGRNIDPARHQAVLWRDSGCNAPRSLAA